MDTYHRPTRVHMHQMYTHQTSHRLPDGGGVVAALDSTAWGTRWWRLLPLLAVCLAAATLWAKPVWADPYPPAWQGGQGAAVHFSPVPWPNEPADPRDCGDTCGDWRPYTRYGYTINDPRTQDPSNGGTAPQNYVNISSSCSDTARPSIYYYYDATHRTLMFRWRVEQIANTYGTGPSAGSFSSSDPWSSALWTVFFDKDGNGFRDLASHLNGSSGSPATTVDRLVGIWGNVPTNQSLDYLNDPNIHLLAHNPTAFVDEMGSVLNFQGGAPASIWPNGAAETTWDYGTSRSRLISKANATDTCNEYFIDYQIPLDLVDASTLGGPRIAQNTAFAMLFCTANSLNNPFQKDCAYGDLWLADPSAPAPFGDYVLLEKGTLQQPIVDTVASTGCGPATLTASIRDTLGIANGKATPSVAAVDFYYYADTNGDGLANDGNTWTLAAGAANRSLTQWTATWDSSNLLAGSYLLGVQAVDIAGRNVDGQANRTFSYLSPEEVEGLTPPPGEHWHANPQVADATGSTRINNTCGLPAPYLSKAADPSETPAGTPVKFTITVHNTLPTPLALSAITDTLPAGFGYLATEDSDLGSETPAPTVGAEGALRWDFAPAAAIPAGSARTLIFSATAPSIVGTYTNRVLADSSYGVLTGAPVQIGVGAPRLTVAKTASLLSARPGDLITYTITYANDSPVEVAGAVISDVLPLGLGEVLALDGGLYDSAARTITWPVGSLAPGDGPYTVRFQARVDDPYPSTAAIPLVNQVTLDSSKTSPATAGTITFVDAPRPKLALQKMANVTLAAPGDEVVFTLAYTNTGSAAAENVVVTDTLPSGFTFQGLTQNGAFANGTATWALGTVAAGASGSVQLTATVDEPYGGANPQTNTAAIRADGLATTYDSVQVAVVQSAPPCTTYYFRNETVSVGADSPPARLTATTSAPAVDDTGTGTQVTLSTAYQEVLRFYQEPAAASDLPFTGWITTTFYIDRDAGPKIWLQTTAYDYDSATGARVQLGTGQTEFQGNHRGEFQVSVPVSGTLRQDHRLLWVLEGKKNSGSGGTVLFQFDGTVANSLSGTNPATFANSRSQVCLQTPPLLTLDKQVDKAQAQAGDTLRYTIRVRNLGQAAATGTQVVDTLPDGLVFTGATLNGAAVTPATVSGPQLTFAVNSSGQASGVVAGGGSAMLVITTTVAQPLDAAITGLVNQATLSSNGTPPQTDRAATQIRQPNLSIVKAASATLLLPGDLVTYTLTVLNSGSGAAVNIVVQDPLPAVPYFSYVAGSAKLNGAPLSPDPVSAGVLSAPIGSLVPGAAAELTFQMRVAESGLPQGVTTLDNAATVADGQTAGSRASNTVTVSISTNPYLRLVKQLSSPLAAGELITYTITVANEGSGAALDVVVEDPIPANTTYVPGSLVYDGSSQSDLPDGDAGHFDAVQNRVLFTAGTLAGGESRTMRFAVRVATPLPAGSTPIKNRATVSASNSSPRAASASASVAAAPALTLRKEAPAVAPFPAARLAAPAEGATMLMVDDSSYLAAGAYLQIGQQVVRILAVDGSSLVVDAPVTAEAGTDLVGSVLYTLHYGNEGNAIATGVRLTDTLPGGVTLVEATHEGVLQGNQVVWALDSLAPGDHGFVQLAVIPTVAGSLLNTATLASAEAGPVTDSATTAVGGLRVTKRTTTPAVESSLSGATAHYVIAVENTLPYPVEGVIVTDTLPAGFTYLATEAISGGQRAVNEPEPMAGDEQPAWGRFTIPANATLSIGFTAQVSPNAGAAHYQNSVEATAMNAAVAQFDALASGEEDLAVQVPIVTLAKSVTPASVTAGDVVTYTIVVRNNGDGAARGVTITDTLPTGFSYLNTAGIALTGSVQVESLSPTAGSTTPSWGRWDISALGQLTITFSAKSGSASGVFSNTVVAGATNTLIPPLSEVAPIKVVAPSVGSVIGLVFDDINGDQSQTGEAGLSAVTVELLDASNTVVLTTTTAAGGTYRFDGLSGGDYHVQVDPPQGYIATTPNPVDVQVTPGGEAIADFGLQQTASVAGVVFHDTNGDKLQQAQEAGLASVTVQLLNSKGTAVFTATTGMDGFYEIDGIVPGSYTVAESNPVGYLSTTPDTVSVILTAGALEKIDFGDQQSGVISGLVYVDTNGNEQQDGDEAGVGSVAVQLDGTEATTQTATMADGSYRFGGVRPGAYTVTVTVPDGYVAHTPSSVVVNVAAGSSARADFGLQQPIPQPAGSIVGVVFHDLNGDGSQDAGEGGLDEVSVVVKTSSGDAVATVNTDAQGAYTLGPLTPGDYLVVEQDPAGFVSTSPNEVPVTLLPGAVATVNFGDRQMGALSGIVFSDPNRSGTQDTEEPEVDGVAVVLYQPDGSEVGATTTADGGRYAFADVLPGAYAVAIAEPDGYIGTTPISTTVSVEAGSAATANFGLLETGAISGMIFADGNQNGVQDPDEGGLSGVTVHLFDQGGTLVESTQTGAGGAYRFSRLAPGVYTVQALNPGGHQATTASSTTVTVAPRSTARADFGYRPATPTSLDTLPQPPLGGARIYLPALHR